MSKIVLIITLLLVTTTFSFPRDKLLHISVSGLLSSAISSITEEETGFLLTLSIGILKEIYDIFTPGTPDIGDIAADVFGDALGISFLSDKECGALLIWEF